MGHEGAYSNDPDDVGGETYCGISRVYNPAWPGWDYIDEMKIGQTGFDKVVLEPLVRTFYKERYWNPFMGDRLQQDIANEMFDTAVNMGIGRAIKFLQQGLNALNRNATLYPDLVEDGDFGGRTLSAYETLPKKDLPVLNKIMNVLQGMHYIEYMRKSPTQEKYARGWFNRVSISK